MFETFRYIPLEPDSNAIRLLTIHPADPGQPSILDCSLVQTSLDNHPEYYALSYAWKDDLSDSQFSPFQEIIVNGRVLRVGCNLAAALKARRDRNAGRIPIWIDAICISQDDIGERNNQILRMRQIYAPSNSSDSLART
jgi:hypothetical protein